MLVVDGGAQDRRGAEVPRGVNGMVREHMRTPGGGLVYTK